MLLYAHPVLQLLALALGLWALVLAWPRIVTLHLGTKKIFNRSRHILLGEICLGGLLLGLAGGMVAARILRGAWLSTGAHAWGGLIMLPLALSGLISGLYLAATPRQRKILPLIHGLANLLVLGLACYQAYTGGKIMDELIKLP